ncbi:MAG TPA: ABC transporter permease [Bryobacteraceae bacterium]|jgi:predicted permease|nr:ABC transporter permease [Bryobacteraceae bacterium]
MWKNLRLAVRQLRKSPAFTVTVVATLALCIGANTAIYSVVDELFFRPLPYPQPDRLVMLARIFHRSGVSSAPNTGQTGQIWELVRDHASLLDSAVYSDGSSGVNLFAAGHVEYVQQQRVGANFFHVLGISPLAGREFTRHENVPGGPPLVILSYGLWQSLFHGNSQILGRTIDLRGAPFTVVGIMPPHFRTDVRADLWTPLYPSTSGEGGGSNYTIVARLKPGVTLAAANAQLHSITGPLIRNLEKGMPQDISLEVDAIPLQVGETIDIRSKVEIIWGAAGLVLLIGCVNIAGIFLTRSVTRTREIATRIALGASRSTVVWQLLSEAGLLALFGGLLGLLFGQLALKGLLALNPGQFQIWAPVHLDLRIAAIMLGVSLTTSLLFGLFPAFEATAVDLRPALAEGGAGAIGSRRQWKRQILVFAEVALGVVLVLAAGLLIRTFQNLAGLDPGFNPQHLMTASLSLDDARYKTSAAGARLFRETLDRIRAIPGVESATVALNLPYSHALNTNVGSISGHQITRDSGLVDESYVASDYFRALEIPLLRGRVLDERDNAHSARVAVVNEAFVDRYIPRGVDPIGAQMTLLGESEPTEIVGVVGNVRQRTGWGNDGPLPAAPQLYVPASQMSDKFFELVNTWFSPNWIVRTRGDLPGLAYAMRRALQAVDPRLPFSAFHSMSQIRGAGMREQRYQAILFSTFAGLGMLLSALGIYGLIAQSVAQRTREMGIRLALGATVRDVVRTAAAPGITLALAGIAAGLVLALFAVRLLKSMLWGVAPTDPITWIAVPILLLLIAAIASLLPALRLARLDPAQTLRIN